MNKSTPDNNYVHGYSSRESRRLSDQAVTLAELFHNDSVFPPGAQVLEAGCGVGAQTITLATKNPETHFTSVDISAESVQAAKKRIEAAQLTNVTFQQADIFKLPFEVESFDAIFICFVLEHLPRPVEALIELGRFLKPGGSIMLIEGDHGSTFFYPESGAADQAINALVTLQASGGGDANIGRKLYPTLHEARFEQIQVSPRMVYADHSRPEWVDGFNEKTFTAMIEGVRDEAIEAGLLDEQTFDQAITDLRRTKEPDGVFCYTFFKAFAQKPF
jgi:SAM-dependent methyltransferase